MAGEDLTLSERLQLLLADHEAEHGARAEHLTIEVDPRDLEDWETAVAALEREIVRQPARERRLVDAARRCLAVLPSNRREMVARLGALSYAVRAYDGEPVATVHRGGA